MTDFELTKLCAKAMEYPDFRELPQGHYSGRASRYEVKNPIAWALYDPLQNDAQAMALVKKLGLNFTAPTTDDKQWYVWTYRKGEIVENGDLNYAIVECVAKMQAEKASVE